MPAFFWPRAGSGRSKWEEWTAEGGGRVGGACGGGGGGVGVGAPTAALDLAENLRTPTFFLENCSVE
jgi:hypothetical protein